MNDVLVMAPRSMGVPQVASIGPPLLNLDYNAAYADSPATEAAVEQDISAARRLPPVVPVGFAQPESAAEAEGGGP